MYGWREIQHLDVGTGMDQLGLLRNIYERRANSKHGRRLIRPFGSWVQEKTRFTHGLSDMN